MTAVPRISVVVATHNRADLLPACVEAVLAQREPPGGFEVLVVDSASADRTPDVIEKLRRGNPDRLRAVREDAPGVARARNRGVRETTGELLAFLDDDAVPEPGWLAALVEALDARGAAAAGGRTVTVWPESGRPWWITDRLAPFFDVPPLPGDAVVPLVFPKVPAPGNALIRRDAVVGGGGFDENVGRIGRGMLSGEDVPLYAWIARRGLPVIYVPQAAVRHGIHPGRLRFRALVRRMIDEGISEARFGRPISTAELLYQAFLLYPAYISGNLLRGRPDMALFESVLVLRTGAFLAERARRFLAATSEADSRDPGNAPCRVCIVYPLLPDPTSFVEHTRGKFPGARLSLYTSNAEAARRAERLGLERIFFQPIPALRLAPPQEALRERFDAVVLAAERSQLVFYVKYYIQVARWRAARKWLDLDGHRMPFRRGWGLFLGAAARSLAGPGKSVLTHAAWLLLLPAALAAGLARGRSAREAARMVRSTGRLLAAPAAYVVYALVPSRLRVLLRATRAVLADFARAPRPILPGKTTRVLLIRMDRIGDLVVTSSLVAALKKTDPPCEITLVVGPWGRAVFEADERIDHLLVFPSDDISVNRRPVGTSEARRERRAIRRLLRGSEFDLALDPANYADSASLLYLPRARARVSLWGHGWFGHGLVHLEPQVEGEHESELLARLCRAGGIEVRPEVPAIRVAPEAGADARRLLESENIPPRHLLVIHPGGGTPCRKWPVERFAEIAVRAHARYGMTPVASFVTGEEEMAARFRAIVRGVPALVGMDLPLRTMFGLLQLASAFVGNDSGFMHAAAALGVPTLGIFGPSEFTHWRPVGPRVATARIEIACSPCWQNFCTDPRCILELGVEQVWRSLTELLGPPAETAR